MQTFEVFEKIQPRFFGILEDSWDEKSILFEDSSGFLGILEDSLGFFEILEDSLGFLKILGMKKAFSSKILGDSWGFLGIL